MTKPRIKPHWKQPSCSLKWQCVSQEPSLNGGYERIGTGYSPAEAYEKWARYGKHYAERQHGPLSALIVDTTMAREGAK